MSVESGVGTGTEKDTGKAVLAHVLALFLGIIGPAIVYLLVDDDEFVKENAANALNWQIVLTIGLVISAFLMLVLIGFVTMVILLVLDLIFIVVAAVKANKGEAWSYPLTPDII